MDNGPEFTSKRLDQWAYLNGVELDFSRPGKPTGNAMIEAFNVRLREKCLNESWFLSLEDARKKIEAWHLKTVRRPPIYPERAQAISPVAPSPTPFRCPHAVHPCPSVDSGLGQV